MYICICIYVVAVVAAAINACRSTHPLSRRAH
jgi:hypothetical protein